MLELGELEARLERLTPADLERGLAVFRSRLGAAEASYLNTCVRCGLCAGSCHYFRADGELESIPAHKLEQVVSVFRRHYSAVGKLAPGLVGARDFDRGMARKWVEAVYGRCSLCGRCSLNCATGIHIAICISIWLRWAKRNGKNANATPETSAAGVLRVTDHATPNMATPESANADRNTTL